MSEVFACAMCGHCCEGEGGIVLAASDQQRLADHLDMAPEAMLRRFAVVSGGKHHLVSGPDGFCIFYEEGKGCAVHPARPDVCRAWPFFRGNLLDPGSLAMAKEDCPGIATDATHAAFQRAGVAYLRQHGLAREGHDLRAEDAGEALRLDFLTVGDETP